MPLRTCLLLPNNSLQLATIVEFDFLLIEESSRGRRRCRGRPWGGRIWSLPASGSSERVDDGGDVDWTTNCWKSPFVLRSGGAGWKNCCCNYTNCRRLLRCVAERKTLEDAYSSALATAAAAGIPAQLPPIQTGSESVDDSRSGDSFDKAPRSRPGCTPRWSRTWPDLLITLTKF